VRYREYWQARVDGPDCTVDETGGRMCVQVDFVNRDSNGRTVSIGGRGGGGFLGAPWLLSVANAIRLVQDPRWTFYTIDPTTNRRALVYSRLQGGQRILTTSPDGRTPNNLDRLPIGNTGLGEVEPSFPERPYLRTPQLVEALRGPNAVAPLRGGSFPVQPAAAVGVRFKAPWPAKLEVTVNGTQVTEVSPTVPAQPQLDAADLGWFYIQEVTDLSPGTELQTWLVRVVPPIGLRRSPVRIRIRQRTLGSRCLPDSTNDTPSLQSRLTATSWTQWLTVEATRTMAHPRLWDYTSGERQELADALEAFLTEAVLHVHHGLDHTTRVVDDHRLYVSLFEDYLWVHGLGKYIPLPYWDPTWEWVPNEFGKVVLGHDPIVNWKPDVALPAALQPSALCSIPTLPELWDAMREFHNAVHATVGGAMRTVQSESPSALIFWPWHAYVDNIYLRWELCGP
jgi:hypothetical protein